MVIKTLKIIGGTVYFNFACESCKNEVDEQDKFCRHCGRKLEPMPRVAELDDVAAILTAAYKGKQMPPEKEEKKPLKSPEDIINDAGDSNINPYDSDIEENDKVATSGESDLPQIVESVCPRGKSKRDRCEFLCGDVECHGICYPTYPPQYPKCVYDKERKSEQ